MSSLAPGITIARPAIAAPGLIAKAYQPLWPAIAAAIIAIAIQSLWLPVDADVSWLLTVSEQVLSGSRLYIDIFEVNPPAAVWIYAPLVALAQLLGVKPEAVVVAAFVVGGLVSTAVTVRLASRLKEAPAAARLTAIVSFVALILPMALFAQREHAALLFALPTLTVIALISESEPVGRRALVVSGLAAGLIIVIKPHFAAAVIAPALWAAHRQRSLTPLVPAVAAGAVIVLLYLVSVLVFTRGYLQWLPTLTATYLPMKPHWIRSIVGPSLYPAICLAIIFILCRRRIPALTMAWMLGAAGFLVAAIVQGKNYPNHWLPQAALALAAAAAVLHLRSVLPGQARRSSVALAAVGLCLMYYWTIRPDPSVTKAIRDVAPPAPRIIALSPDLITGHPVTRNVGGTWVGSRAALFTASGARFVQFKGPVAQHAYREDIRSFLADVRRGRPDVILVDIESKDWLMAEPEIARSMADYRFASARGDTEIWVRKPGP